MSASPHHPTAGNPARGYHHGNLAEALLDAGVELARSGGPDAVVLREAARRVGVSATAAYRHFDSQTALVRAVKERALGELAEHMEVAAGAAVALGGSLAAADRLEAMGRAYLQFALGEPGLFRTFCIGLPLKGEVELHSARAFGVLTDVLSDLTAQGLIDPETALTAPIAAWATVHGLAVLCLDGPLSEMLPAEREGVFAGTLRMVLSGLLAHQPGGPQGETVGGMGIGIGIGDDVGDEAADVKK